jgi:cation transport ATPase
LDEFHAGHTGINIFRSPFYISSWKSLKHKFLNIDAPIALAIIVTFARSAYEVLSGTGAVILIL